MAFLADLKWRQQPQLVKHNLSQSISTHKLKFQAYTKLHH